MIKQIFILVVLLTGIAHGDNKVDSYEITLEKFIDHVAKKTDKTILYDDSIRAKRVYLVNLKAQSNQDLLKMLHSILEFNGYFVEIVGTGSVEVLKIKRSMQAPWTSTLTLVTKEELDAVGDQDILVTMVIPMENVDSREMQSTLRSLRIVNPQSGNIAGIEESNTLLITDFAPNVKRIYSIIKSMDKDIKAKKAVGKSFAVEGQEIALPLEKTKEYILTLKTNENIVLVAKDQKGNIINNSCGTKAQIDLGYYIKNNDKIDIELDSVKTDLAEVEVKISKKGDDSSIWEFSFSQILKKDRNIKFKLVFAGR